MKAGALMKRLQKRAQKSLGQLFKTEGYHILGEQFLSPSGAAGLRLTRNS
jgi:hypothetical protein